MERISQQRAPRSKVNRVANSLVDEGLMPGDRIAIDMPMTLEAVCIYLGAIKAGLAVATIADSFTPNEIAVRLRITQPKLLFTQDLLRRGRERCFPCTRRFSRLIHLGRSSLQTSDEGPKLRTGDQYFADFLVSNEEFQSHVSDPEGAITILFSSGTTGEPKAIPWNHVTPIKGASDGYYHHDIHPNDVVCWPTNLGWMMGPWLIFAALINKASIALYYGAPLGEGFGRFVQDARVTMLGVVPSIVRQWKITGCNEEFDWSSDQVLQLYRGSVESGRNDLPDEFGGKQARNRVLRGN